MIEETEPAEQTLNIMIVEDNEFMRKVMSGFLRGNNYCYAKNGKDALAQYDLRPLNVIFVDLGLPDMSGLDLIKQLQAKNPEIFIVVVTGDHDPMLFEKAFELGVKGYITKPYSFQDVAKYLDKFKQDNVFNELF